MFVGHPCEIFLIKKQLFSRKMLNKRKLKYNFGTECILLETVYNRDYIYDTKSDKGYTSVPRRHGNSDAPWDVKNGL